MDERISQISAAMAKAGLGLLALPLAELPPIASVHVRIERDEGLRVELQLATPRHTAAALWAWADALPERQAAGKEQQTYIYVEVSGEIDGVRVAVWDHIKGKHLVEAGCFLGLPLDGEKHGLPLAALRGLAERLEVTTDA